jgi:hypothetical protein
MKITKLFAAVFFLASVSMGAQEIANHAFGLRLGESDGFGAELSYQKSIGRYSRIELNAGYRDSREFDAFKATLLYQNVFELSRIFNWYYGFGGGAGSAKFEAIPAQNNPNLAVEPEGGLFVFAAGDIGVEANLNLPLVISLDIRPEIGIIGYESFDNSFEFDVALGIRYQF